MIEIIKLELKHLLQNRFLLAMYFVMPLFCAVFIYITLQNEVVRKLPIGLLDLDNTQTTRDIIFDINASPVLESRFYTDLVQAQDALSTKEIYALVVFQKDLEKDIILNKVPKIVVYYNAQLVFIGKNIYSALLQIFSTVNIKLKFKKHLVESKNTTLALSSSINIAPKFTALYNKNSNFTQFMLPTLLPCLWQLFIILCMIGIIASDESDVGFIKNKQNRIKDFHLHLSIKIIINSVIFFIWWAVMYLAFYHLGYIHNGNINILALNAVVTIFAYNSIGIFIYALIGSHTRAISIAAVYAAPSLAFVGITYPINNMEVFATFWGEILPITKYLLVYIQQASYGVDSLASLKLISYNLIFLLFGILGILIYKKKVALL
ncbi:MAG: ABC transporter permease [Helicobacteraceae bacterium]|nr:ABC transporter permease [Helicobacteraceae bacterium]